MEGIAGLLEKTDTGRQEIAARTGSLDRRHRALLIMVDGRTSADDLLERTRLLGLEADAVFELLRVGYIRPVAAPANALSIESMVDAPSQVEQPGRAAEKRSLATAKLYLMDIMVRTFGTADNAIRMRLISAADLAAVEQSFEEFLVVLRGMAKPSMVAHIEESFRALLPISEGNQVG